MNHWNVLVALLIKSLNYQIIRSSDRIHLLFSVSTDLTGDRALSLLDTAEVGHVLCWSQFRLNIPEAVQGASPAKTYVPN